LLGHHVFALTVVAVLLPVVGRTFMVEQQQMCFHFVGGHETVEKFEKCVVKNGQLLPKSLFLKLRL
jgi:hypothetical protein